MECLYELDNDRVIYENNNSEIVIENIKQEKRISWEKRQMN